jgi:hypothetical protein
MTHLQVAPDSAGNVRVPFLPPQIEIISSEILVPSEDIDLDRVRWVAKKILSDDAWLVPIDIEETSCVVMDGHHRLYAAELLSISRVPVMRWSYSDVTATGWDNAEPLDPDRIIACALSRRILPAKSIRHLFPCERSCRVPLHVLRELPPPH